MFQEHFAVMVTIESAKVEECHLDVGVDVRLVVTHLGTRVLRISLAINLAIGYRNIMTKASDAARDLARRSVAARRLKWGEEGFRKRMQAWGKLGGRPRSKKGKRHAN